MCKARQFVVLKAFFLHEKVDLKISCYTNLSNLQYQNAVVFSASQCILLGFVIYYHQNKANFPNIYWDKLANAEIILTQYNFPTAEESWRNSKVWVIPLSRQEKQLDFIVRMKHHIIKVTGQILHFWNSILRALSWNISVVLSVEMLIWHSKSQNTAHKSSGFLRKQVTKARPLSQYAFSSMEVGNL